MPIRSALACRLTRIALLIRAEELSKKRATTTLRRGICNLLMFLLLLPGLDYSGLAVKLSVIVSGHEGGEGPLTRRSESMANNPGKSNRGTVKATFLE